MTEAFFRVGDEVIWSKQAPKDLAAQYGAGPFIIVTKLMPSPTSGAHRGAPADRVIIRNKQANAMLRDERGIIKQFACEWFYKVS
ncbi:MAG: hypothetical protein C3F02_00100 [Parcubacteria group bacterium]|nr:MAG: hypothetical protein C3F02_00100 [Parcubacteria group bacterium]